MKSYEALAAVYDRLGRDIDYAAFADFYEARFRENGEKPSLVLDLGCGTGQMTTLLAERGYDMIGVDASAEMLSHAASRAFATGHRILFLEQDMREFELYGTVGAVVSTLDCINYLVDDGDLDRCFSLVHNYLDPAGLFLFDLNTPYKFRTVYGDNAYVLEDEDSLCAWQNEYDEKTRLCHFYLSVFERARDGRYVRRDEEQIERCYSEKEIRDALARAGFVNVTFYGDVKGGAPTDTTERWLISAKKG